MVDAITSIGRQVLPEPIKKWLRGERNSVRYRFYDHPKEHLGLWFFKLRGGTYLEWYARRMDGHARGASIEQMEQGPTKSYFEAGRADVDILSQLGMKPSSTLHEIGIGQGRSSQFFIEFLDAGNFSGNDISAERMRFAREVFAKRGLEDKRPNLIVNTDNEMNWLGDKKVDYIWAGSVFGHMPPEDVEEIFENLKRMMHDDTIFVFTWRSIETDQKMKRHSVKDWFRNYDYWYGIGERFGFDIEDVQHLRPDDYVPPQARLTKVTIKRGGAGG